MKLPENILKTLRNGEIAYTKALAIARIKEEQQKTELLQQAIAENLSIREIKERIKQLTEQKTVKTHAIKTAMEETLKKLKKSKIWNHPKKQKKLEKLLVELQLLLEE